MAKSNLIDAPDYNYRHCQGELTRVRAEGDAENVYRYTFKASSTGRVRVFGNTYEVLEHGAGAVRMGWFASGNAPFLWMHDREKPIGIIEGARLENSNIVLDVLMSPNATDIVRDIDAGILKNVSVGYRIFKESVTSRDEVSGETVWTVTDWEPRECSLVTVPADDSVGFGRSERSESLKSRDRNQVENNSSKTNTMDTPPSTITTVEAERSRTDAVTTERNRVSAISAAAIAALAAGLGDFSARADEAIKNGSEVADFQRHILDNVKKTPGVSTEELGLSQKEAKRYDFGNVINGMLEGDLSKRAAFELEVSSAIKKRQDRGADPERVAIPADVLLRGYIPRNPAVAAAMGFGNRERAMVSAVATTGALSETGNQAAAHMISNDLLPDMLIESLREEAIILGLGVTMLPGLTGDVRIPREIIDPLFYWVGEDREPTEGNYDLDEIALNFKTVAARIPFTRQSIKQSSRNIENMALASLRRGLALAIDNALLNGTGASGQPLGVFGTAGIGAVTTGGSPSYANLLALWAALSNSHVDQSRARLVTNTLGAQRLLETKKDAGSGEFLAKFGESNNRISTAIGMAEVCNTVPAAKMLYGDFSKLFVGMWGSLEIVRDTSTKVATGGVVLRFFQDIDCKVARSSAFAAIADIA